MFKSLLLPYVNDLCEGAVLSSSMELAEKMAAHLVVLVVPDAPRPVISEFGANSYDIYAQLTTAANERASELVAKLKARCAKMPGSIEVRLADATAIFSSDSAALHARYADLSILPAAPTSHPDSSLTHEYCENLLLNSGQPVLVVPAQWTALQLPKRIVIAWQPTREASRAVRDAMPFLRQAESVEILIVDPKLGANGHGPEPGADIAAHLARHGLKVQVTTQASFGKPISESLLAHARFVEADLLVAGGYGHSRLSEFLFGGVTRRLLQNTETPILFSH